MPECQFDNDCPITKSTRSYCATCRLKKCFAEGMDPLIIRSAPNGSKKSKKILISKNSGQQQVRQSMLRLIEY